MKKLIIWGCITFFIFCAPKKTTVKTEGLEEIIVFGEEEQKTNVSEEPVYPFPSESIPPAETTTPAPEITPPPVEVTTLPPVVEEKLPTEEVSPITPPPIEEEPIPLPTEEVAVAPITPPPKPVAPVVPAPSVAPKAIYGFRVQIFASSTERNALRVADDARSSFGGRVYIEHVPPYYKVRIGDCLTREEAEVLKNRALSFGYRKAFVVETMITP